MEKSWTEMEMDETKTLFTKKIHEMNEIHPDHLDCGDVEMIERMWNTIHIIHDIQHHPSEM